MKNLTDDELNAIELNITDALLEAAEFRNNPEEREIVIQRKGKVLFKFRVTGITEEQWQKCRRQNLLNRGKRNEELNNPRFISQAIYEATVPEDKYIWNNHDVWEKLNVATGTDVINKILLPGEKTALADLLEELSGFNTEVDELLKN